MRKFNFLILIIVVLTSSGCGKEKNIDFNDAETISFYNLTLEIPKVFISDKSNSDEYIKFYTYTDEEKTNSCMLSISISDYPKKDMLEAVKEGLMDKTDFTYNEKSINSNNWSIGNREESAKFSQSYYVINYKGKEYSLSYDDFGSGEKCSEALKVIEKSLKFNN